MNSAVIIIIKIHWKGGTRRQCKYTMRSADPCTTWPAKKGEKEKSKKQKPPSKGKIPIDR